ncbi:hypothetical protein N8I77_002223 [Diaporthe amygdali]|uniref:Uncharacterized protein n=1 Tax=Phomopsis amygdali TaxID=1214568 RepID=A0AAD9STP7_PHOAM|nr:hypothetical protein N8I77_002223 [Diaporthe amygdali]
MTSATTLTSPRTRAVNNETITMEIPLKDVVMVQLFLYADDSVKGISFNYQDTDIIDFGCCEAEPGGWFPFMRPEYLLFTPLSGHPVDRGFFPVECINFAASLDGTETQTNSIRMKGSLVFRLSINGLEIDARDEKDKKEVPLLIEAVQEAEKRRDTDAGTRTRCKRSFDRTRNLLRGWLRRNFFFRGCLIHRERMQQTSQQRR